MTRFILRLICPSADLHKTLALFALVAWGIQSASAQELTKDEQGLVAISQCYSTCMDRAMPIVWALEEDEDRYRTNPETISRQQYTESSCENLQYAIHSMDTCQAGCRDLETVYGTIKSYARSRYFFIFNDLRTKLAASGLWTNYRDFPELGTTAFEIACDRVY